MSEIKPPPSNDRDSDYKEIFCKALRNCSSDKILITLFILAMIFLFISAHAERVGPFKFQVDFLEVTSMTFAHPNNSITIDQRDNAQFRLNLTMNNNRAKFFGMLHVTVEYDHHLVFYSRITPFHQDALSGKTIPVQMGMADTRLPDRVIDSISRKLVSEGVLDFTVIVSGDFWYVDSSGTCDMEMVCEGVPVTFSSTNNTWNGSTKDGPFSCNYNTKNC